jgi:hypothetical protein
MSLSGRPKNLELVYHEVEPVVVQQSEIHNRFNSSGTPEQVPALILRWSHLTLPPMAAD